MQRGTSSTNSLQVFERLSWRIMPSYRVRYNKTLLPGIIQVALHDQDMEARRIALDGIAASGAEDVVPVFVKLFVTLTDEQYKGVIRDNVWSAIVDNGFGPKLRQGLFREFEGSDGTIRNRISKETAGKYLG